MPPKYTSDMDVVLILPDGLTELGAKSYRSEPIYSVKFPQTLESIESEAFANCKKLKKLHFPFSMEYIGANAFSGCIALESVAGRTLKEIIFGEGVFRNCTSLEKVNLFLPSYIPSELFSGCSKLETVRETYDGIREIGTYAFNGCKSLVFDLPKSLEVIRCMAFQRCTSLVEINIPLTLKEIDDYAFAYSSVEKINFPPGSNVKIGPRAFYACKNLKRVLVPKAVEIHESAFPKYTKITRGD